MSWTVLTFLIVIASFVCAFGLCEWLAKRIAGRERGGRPDDNSAMG